MIEVKQRRDAGGGWETLELSGGLMKVTREGVVERVANLDARGPFVSCLVLGTTPHQTALFRPKKWVSTDPGDDQPAFIFQFVEYQVVGTTRWAVGTEPLS